MSFRANPDDTDKILIFNRHKKCLDKIDLYQPGQDRVFAQALLFGRKGRLFVPLFNTGEVRRYNVNKKTFDVLVPSVANGGVLGTPTYLTFGHTDPRTLEYEDD